MPTVSDLIHSSFRLIGAIASGEILETSELNDALISLNQMIASWNTEGASLVGRRRISTPIFAGQVETVLPVSDRPIQIVAASSSINGVDSPIELVNAEGWEAVQEKALSSIYIKKLYCDYLYPQCAIHWWPSARMSGQIYMWTLQAITQFSALNQTIDLAPGYEQALRYNFAVALLPEYPRSQVDPTLPAQAQNFKASLVQLDTMNHSQASLPPAAPPQ